MSPRDTTVRSAEPSDAWERPEDGEFVAETPPADHAAPAAPAFVPKPAYLVAAYMLASLVAALTQGLGLSFVSVNVQQIAGPLEATQTEVAWLIAAYLFPNVSLTLLLFKIRAQIGIRNFCEVAIVAYVLVCIAHLWANDFQTALVLRFFAGAAAAPISSIAFLYMLETLSPARKMNIGLCLALTALAMATPVAGLISPKILELGDVHGLLVVEMGLAMLTMGFIYVLPLASPPRAKVISIMDLVSYGFLAIAMGLFAVVLTIGRLYWWLDAPWLGWMLVVSIISAVALAVIELNRKNQLLDIRWLTSREIMHFTGALLVFRIILSEQSYGAINFLRNVGLLNEQMAGFYIVLLVSAVAAGLLCATIMKPGRESAIHSVALLLLALGSYIDSHSTILTRPEQMYFSQALIGFAGGLFLPPAMAVGLMSAIKRGPNYILSFVIVFLTTQKIGGALGSALFGTFVQWREQFHSERLVSRLSSADPLVAARLRQLGGAYGKVLTDPGQQTAQGAALLARQVTQQAYVLAYNDAFLMSTYLALLALACLLIHVAWRNRARLMPRKTTSELAA